MPSMHRHQDDEMWSKCFPGGVSGRCWRDMKAARKSSKQMLTLAAMAAVMTRTHIKAWLTRAESSFVYAERKVLQGKEKGCDGTREEGLRKQGETAA